MKPELQEPRRPRVRLWMKLAIFAAFGVIATHAVHLGLATRISTDALAKEQELLGRRLARMVAREAADPVLVNDTLTLHEVVGSAAAGEGVGYCLIVRGGKVLASSFGRSTPSGLLNARVAGDAAPLIISRGGVRYLDLVEPILGGEAGEVRIGIDMGILRTTRRNLATALGLVAAAVIGLGLIAALLVGRSIARPVGELLEAADAFDPGLPPRKVRPYGSDEIAVLTVRFNRMMERLAAAHAEQVRARQKGVETERLVALGSLVAGVSHEVNNPLAGMKNCLRALRRKDLPETKREEYFGLMDEGLERIGDVVRRLLDFARPRPLALGAVRAADLLRDGAALVRPALEKRQIRWEEQLDGCADAVVLADRRQASQALLNLVLNAAYFSPEGGRLRLRVRARPGLWGLSVEDEGPGIPPEIRDRILDPYFSTKPEGEGTGLGLSVTRTIADAHGGELSFEFPEGGGTCATLWLRDGSGSA